MKAYLKLQSYVIASLPMGGQEGRNIDLNYTNNPILNLIFHFIFLYNKT